MNNFVREFLGLPDDGSTVPTTLELMGVSALLETSIDALSADKADLSALDGYVKRTEVQPATYQTVYPAYAQNAVAAT